MHVRRFQIQIQSEPNLTWTSGSTGPSVECCCLFQSLPQINNPVNKADSKFSSEGFYLFSSGLRVLEVLSDVFYLATVLHRA